MKFNKAKLIEKVKEEIARNDEWENGRLQEINERVARNANAYSLKQGTFIAFMDELLEFMRGELEDGEIVVREGIVAIGESYNIDENELKNMIYRFFPKQIDTVADGEVPHATFRRKELVMLLNLLEMTTSDEVSTYAIKQAGFKGHIPMQ